MATAGKLNPEGYHLAEDESHQPANSGIISSNFGALFSNKVAIGPDLLRQMGNRAPFQANSGQYGHIVARRADYPKLTSN